MSLSKKRETRSITPLYTKKKHNPPDLRYWNYKYVKE